MAGAKLAAGPPRPVAAISVGIERLDRRADGGADMGDVEEDLVTGNALIRVANSPGWQWARAR
jgi:hypothetical protein